MPAFHSYTSRALLGVGFVALFWLALYAMTANRASLPNVPPSIQSVSAPTPGPRAMTTSLKRTTLAELPALPQKQGMPSFWDLVDGLNAASVGDISPPAGQTALRLTALASEERHAISVRFVDLSPGTLYRVTVWLKSRPTQRVMIEARDSVVANTGKAAHYGIAHFDMANGSVMRASGDLKAQGIDGPKGDWLPLWCDVRTKDGQIYVLLGLLESPSNQHIFKGAGQELVLGGFEIARR